MVPILLALLVGGIAVALTQGWLGGSNAATEAAPSVLGTAQTTSTGTPAPSTTSDANSSSTTSPSPTQASATPTEATSGGAGAKQALQDCQRKVQARDEVLRAARTGVGHWSEHVTAQTDANNGKISVARMNAIFKRTRLTGPADVQRYRAAVTRRHQLRGSCSAPTGASPAIAASMTRCAQRQQAQKPVLAAAENAMDDWQSHLSAMRMSRMGHVDHPQAVWIKAWRAAPPHIKAYRKATSSFDAPSC